MNEFNFSFATATQIIFGNHSIRKLSASMSGMGKNALVVTGNNDRRNSDIIQIISEKKSISVYKVTKEPTIDVIIKGVEFARNNRCDFVVGFGGGSVIDAAKAISALVPNKKHILSYLEVIGEGKPLTESPLPFIAIPTTAGTGAEVTKNAVIKSPEKKVKVSLRNDLMFPDVAIVDPVFTYSMPPELTASTGVDALTHLLETFVSCQANGFVDMICREGLSRISRSLLEVYKNGNNKKAREDMALASMLGGMALANVKLGAIHGFAGPMGGMFTIPHGAACACLMAAVIETNIKALTKNGEDISKYKKLAKIVTKNKDAEAQDAIVWANNLVKELKIPALSSFGLTENNFPELVQKAKNASSMKGNPVVLSDNELFEILSNSL